MTYHVPVLLPHVLSGLAIKPHEWYIDATVGGGGYAVEILKAGGNILGIDTDSEAIAYTRQRIVSELPDADEGKRWRIVHNNFRHIHTIALENELTNIQGILFDLGFSSHQIDTQERGMSYRFPDQPFDLRLNQHAGEPAYELINRLSKEELYEILAKYGEEELSQSISNHIYRARRVKPIHTIGDVIRVIEEIAASPAKERILARVFQAFRIVVNDELGALKEGLAGSEAILQPGGRLAVISFHSLEDRITKQFLRNGHWQNIESHAITADEDEREINRRSRSAKLRVAIKL